MFRRVAVKSACWHGRIEQESQLSTMCFQKSKKQKSGSNKDTRRISVAAYKLGAGLTSEVLGQASQPGGPFYGVENSNGGLITFSGGVPLIDKTGETAGGIGVSGGTSEQDAAIARAGAAAFSA
jgi:uncharacterized protein GlcG (DUF336 family)